MVYFLSKSLVQCRQLNRNEPMGVYYNSELIKIKRENKANVFHNFQLIQL